MVTLDTNVVSALIAGQEQVVAHWKQARISGVQVRLNAISYYETRRGLVLPHFARKFAAFERLVKYLPANISRIGKKRQPSPLPPRDTSFPTRSARVNLKINRDILSLQGLLLLDRPTLDIAATIYQGLRSRGTLLEDADILVAAIALSNGATLVTRNLKHFERVEGLQLESWEA